VLDGFGLALRRCATPADEMRLTLDAVAEAVAADCVFWQARPGGEAAAAVGAVELPPDWCAEFLASATTGDCGEEGLLLRHFLDPGARRRAPWPLSALLARLGETNGEWLAALRFPPSRLFAADDLHALRLARRLLLNHRQRGVLRDQLRESLEMRVRRLSAAIEELLRDGGPTTSGDLSRQLRDCQRELDTLCGADIPVCHAGADEAGG
jgi:hypothetical protein